MTPFSSSQGGGPGRSQPPAVTRKHRKRPRKWGSGRSVPVGSMETRDAGGLAPGPAGDRLPSCANRRRGKRSAPRTAERGSGPAPPQRRRSTAGSATAAHPRGEPRRAGDGEEERLPRTPAPSQRLNWERQKLRGHRGNIPTEPGDAVSSEVRPFTFQAGVSCFLRASAGVTGEKTADCRCSTGCAANPGSGK